MEGNVSSVFSACGDCVGERVDGLVDAVSVACGGSAGQAVGAEVFFEHLLRSGGVSCRADLHKPRGGRLCRGAHSFDGVCGSEFLCL